MPEDNNITSSETRSGDELVRLIIEALHRTMIHYALWWKETERRLGPEACIALESTVWDQWFKLATGRIGQTAGTLVSDGIPEALSGLKQAELEALRTAMSVNWLACDGLWFQAVERHSGLAKAQECNNAAWEHFSPFEAARIKQMHGLPDQGGLDALDQALRHRLYAHINKYTIERPDSGTLVLHMNDCRVQSARKRKGLADYPCKSGGMIEYTTFASAIDPRIRTECLGCPPDPHPDSWFCGWRFRLP
ncbi:MAG: DUF6125 family protein [Candidatus Zixiibacteriota bacterium]